MLYEVITEKADEIKQQLKQLESYQSKSTVVNPKMQNVDVFSIVDDVITSYSIHYTKLYDSSFRLLYTIILMNLCILMKLILCTRLL